jgi:2-oxoglutarate ferredoxin oxidoreductase subunit alpha
VDAFDLSDRYRIVAMILGDGYLGQMSESLVLPEPPSKHYDKSSWILEGAAGRDPRIIASLRLKPEDGVEQVNLRLQEKYREIEAEEIRFECYQCQDAEVLLVAFGLAARVCKAAVNQLRSAGARVGLFRPITLWPFPYGELLQRAGRMKKVLVVEMNAGQMLEDVRLALGDKVRIEFYGRMGAMLVEEEEIIKRIRKES